MGLNGRPEWPSPPEYLSFSFNNKIMQGKKDVLYELTAGRCAQAITPCQPALRICSF
jgi:hypothetical protein